MPRVIIKGGVWRNTEDEILKAGVMKYGKNQWSRIASLLHRKSAKQCKARWFQWLDPNIKKTEWSKEEEEKLLHSAKLMPTQWRTISLIVGRTASQCLEHYEYLLDQAQKNDDDKELRDDPRKIKPGEIDPNPETKPARPDPKDMDEDEIEMLSEARARLANTQGKKAKRKAREKQLEEARRLASLQKRRELRMAGIYLGTSSRKKKGIDYNAEIPFEKSVPAGLHDTSNEIYEPASHDFKKLRQQHLDGELSSEREARERKKDKLKAEKRKENEFTGTIGNNLEPVKKRSKLVLPEPQILDKELEQVIKLGRVSIAAKEAAEESGNNPSETLLADYVVTSSSAISNIRTPRTPASSRDTVLMEAQNLIALSNVDTPLKGGINTPLHETGIGTGEHKTPITPTPNNLLVTPFRTPGSSINNIDVTPETPTSLVSNREIESTPLRDKLNINPEESLSFESDVAKEEYKASLRNALSSIPAPKDDYEIILTEEKSTEESVMTMDQADIDAMREAQIAAEIEAEIKRQSQAVQRNLPRPSEINSNILRPIIPEAPLSELQLAEEEIKKEMLILLHYDALKNPTDSQMMVVSIKAKSGSNVNQHAAYLQKHPYVEIPDDELENAKNQLAEEMAFVKEKLNHGDLSLNSYCTVWDECISQLLYLPSQNKYTRANLASRKDKIESYEKQLETNRNHMNKEAQKAGKLEKKLKILFGGYQSRASNLIKSIQETVDQIELTRIELETFKMLEENEEIAIQKRIAILTDDVRKQNEREKELQNKYDKFMRSKEEVIANQA